MGGVLPEKKKRKTRYHNLLFSLSLSCFVVFVCVIVPQFNKRSGEEENIYFPDTRVFG